MIAYILRLAIGHSKVLSDSISAVNEGDRIIIMELLRSVSVKYLGTKR